MLPELGKINASGTLQPVIQQEPTGCGIAAAAALAGLSYRQARSVANRLGIRAGDPALWSDPQPVLRLLAELGVPTGRTPVPFTGWAQLPDRALLAIKWHLEHGRPCWHWVVFDRSGTVPQVLDSRPALRHHLRTDFGRMHPKWFIEVFTKNSDSSLHPS